MTSIGTKFLLAQRFTFDPNSNSLADQQNGTDVVRLGSNESRILLMLAERPNEVLTRNELHEFVWREQGFEVDDSSLTQAISTLRKMLKDSTKSPQFVKTVPKRGYQLICSVERINPLSSVLNSETEELASDDESDNTESEIISNPPPAESISETKVDNEPSREQLQVQTGRRPNAWLSRLMILVAILLPISVLLFTNPAESKFRQVDIYQNVPVLTPVNHPQINDWLPSIKQCVERYVEHHAKDSSPVEVIATGGQNNQLVLNYIHDINHSYENVTLRIVSGQNDPADICK
ncbi:transcriptional regulator [Vibrio sp. EA2]|uniref:transcriptional regulator n=1 Tax=Vibrio sp. EA2 TaxID=3079860 RepID=UPI002949C0E2|nr:transcriptional regulator [Vibrio sp. EA2]MDV6253121.1 transcriptional regulator [Vibrio sp. EA2]